MDPYVAGEVLGGVFTSAALASAVGVNGGEPAAVIAVPFGLLGLSS
jgi:hypothetical protein